MNPLPFSAGQKVVCVFADFPDAVHGHFDRLPEEGGIYTISEAFLCPEHITRRIIPSVRLMELPPLQPGKSGFSAWRFRRVEEEIQHRRQAGKGKSVSTIVRVAGMFWKPGMENFTAIPQCASPFGGSPRELPCMTRPQSAKR